MSKLLKADDPRLNGVINWRIHSIQKTQKNGKTPDSYESQRSKIFNIVDCNGKINSHLIQFTEILWSSLVEKVLLRHIVVLRCSNRHRQSNKCASDNF